MAGQILIADDLSLNRTVLRGKLTSACYRTITANYHMPDMDGLAVCRALRADPVTRDIPVILFSATADRAHRLGALAAGADDFMTKPLDEAYLLGRIRSLLRNVARRDEWRNHPNTALQGGLAESAVPFAARPSITLVTGHAEARRGWLATMSAIWPEAQFHDITVSAALRLDTTDRAPDMFIITPEALKQVGLHVIAELRSRSATRQTEICLILQPEACANAAMALDLGAADILSLPLDRAESKLRLEKVIARKRATDAQHRALEYQLGLAAFDPLTGLHNRSHALMQLSRAAEHCDSNLALLLIDLDRFKEINDTHGHNAGDDVLRQVAQRMQKNLRHNDILCRYGGEEFLLAMPHADLPAARLVAERLCAQIGDTPYVLRDSAAPRMVTASIGRSVHRTNGAPLDATALAQMIGASDMALRNAKRSGRNRVVTDQAALV